MLLATPLRHTHIFASFFKLMSRKSESEFEYFLFNKEEEKGFIHECVNFLCG